MPKEPLFPHRPKSKEPQFPHVPKGSILPQTRAKGEYKINTDYMGNIIITRTGDPEWDVFLQFEADKDLVYDLLKKGERKDLDAGWSITIKRTEPRASTLDDLWETRATQTLPQTLELLASTEGDPLRKFCCRFSDACAPPELLEEGKFLERISWLRQHYKEKHPGMWGKMSPMTVTTNRKPTRHDVEIGTWAERDRIGIWLTDKRTDKAIAEWWDEDAREMFDQGFFKPGDIRHQAITGRAFEDSVLDYAESVGILASGDRFLPQTVLRPKDAYYWTAVNKDTGEIVESFTPYTSSGRALRGGRAYATRHWKAATALVEVWSQPHRYSEDLKIQPVEKLVLGG